MGKLLDVADRLIRSRRMVWGAGVASLLETTILPIPIEVVLVPVMVRNRSRSPGPWTLAAATLVGCLLGGLVGYAVGYLFWDTAGQWIVQTLEFSAEAGEYRDRIEAEGFWVVLSTGLTPVPFQLATIVSGAVGYNIALFMIAAALARGVRYFGLALLVQLMGDRAERFVNEHPGPIIGGGIVLFIAIYATIKWLG